MAHTIEYRYSLAGHPVQTVFLAGTIPLFLGAALSDFAYARSAHIQWNNFASWFLVGGLIFCGIALLFAIVDLCRPHRRRARGFVPYAVLLLVTWLLGLYNALMHARDAWASMPMALYLSVAVTVLACATACLGLHARHWEDKS